MDQELAQNLLNEGGVLLFLDVPTETEFGIDFKSWNTAENFKGIKMIPPGMHYIFYSAVSSTGDKAPRSGFFHNFRAGEMIVRKWDGKEENMSSCNFSEYEIASFRRNMPALDPFLGPYPLDIYKKWVTLTENMTDQLIDRLIPSSGIVKSVLELQHCTNAERLRQGCVTIENRKRKRIPSTLDDMDQMECRLLPHMVATKGFEWRFTQLPERHYPEGSTPSEITQHSLDATYVFDTMMSNYKEASEIIGEIEFCFICFLIGHSLEAFEQWKKLLNLFCSCGRAITKYRKIYNSLLTVLELQVCEIPQEFLADIVTNNNFFYAKMRDLFRNIVFAGVDSELQCKANRFKEFLTSKFGWKFLHLDLEDEDEAPVVVEME
ncbi:protein AAR2 homolog [Harmonia axyridis]|uniref:protein AAR2 homolog n=1 Tax=Harmonia axyridis TaxID=115357 RepID=UPI001E274F73|nr:protein AAR2 homolog [Harmonia axyridis]